MLTHTCSIWQNVAKVKVEPEADEEQTTTEPRNQATVTSVSLVVVRQKPTAPDGTNFYMWQGKQVKNFKKFRKVNIRSYSFLYDRNLLFTLDTVELGYIR